jgi:mono/diheme cytochrome c family protein
MKWGFREAVKCAALALISAALVIPLGAQEERKVVRPSVNMPRGPVRQVLLTSCTSCHGIDDYAYYALDRAGWQALLESRHKGKPVVISDQDQNILLDYLAANFGPNWKPFPRTYIPGPVTKPFSDDDGKAFVEKTCTSCHEVERVYGPRRNDPLWRSIVLDMRERGAKLSDEDVERLVEYLYRVWGTDR